MKKMISIFLVILFLIGVAAIVVGIILAEKSDYKKVEVVFETEKGEVRFLTDVADNTLKRTRGLSGRENLSEREGMLFIYTMAVKPGFWMKEMNFPIDIIWIKGEEVIGITEGATLESYKEGKIFYPSMLVDRVLEIKAGEAKKEGIKEGTRVKIVFNNL